LVEKVLQPVQRLTASAYLRRMTSGRTNPAIFLCEDENGNSAGEYVVKFKAGTEAGVTGLCCELIASLLAGELGLARPTPAIVEIDPRIGDLVSSQDAPVAASIKKSGGPNFGSKVLSGGYNTWPANKNVPASLMQLAAEIYAFDALIQNPDRKANNPNLLWKGDEIYLIDHELAFSFIFQIGGTAEPWQVRGSAGSFLANHVFGRDLKGRLLDLNRFKGALDALSDSTIETLVDQMPIEWKNDHLSKIRGHLSRVRDRSGEFVEQVKWRLV
jgi:hypothetical protein